MRSPEMSFLDQPIEHPVDGRFGDLHFAGQFIDGWREAKFVDVVLNFGQRRLLLFRDFVRLRKGFRFGVYQILVRGFRRLCGVHRVFRRVKGDFVGIGWRMASSNR